MDMDDDDTFPENYSEESEDEEDTFIETQSDIGGTTEDDILFPTPPPNCTVLSTSDILEFMRRSLQEANSIIQLPTLTVLRLLLNFFKWDKELLMEAYYEKTPAELSQMTGIDVEQNTKPILKRKAGAGSLNRGQTEECGICLTDIPLSKLFGLRCKHLFCTGCWKEFLRTQIMVEGQGGEALSCPAHACTLLVDDEAVIGLISEETNEVKAKFQRLITNNFVVTNRSLTWCPKAGCENVIKKEGSSGWSSSVSCDCGYQFCFLCSQDLHDPINCSLLEKWKVKIRDGAESASWLNVHTKNCPKCTTPIEKNGGCNHMMCKMTSCHHQFCWICLQPWTLHKDSFSCNVFVEKDPASTIKQSKAESILKRYLHFFNHYNAHVSSLKLERKLTEIIDTKIQDCLVDFEYSWAEAQFVRKAVLTLRSSRQTLLHTYIFAYYIEQNNQREIFEANQADLQGAVEDLSGYLETHLIFGNGNGIHEVKQLVMNKTNYCSSRCQVLVDHIKEGFEKDWWTFTD